MKYCHPFGEDYTLQYLIDDAKDEKEIRFIGKLPTNDECLAPNEIDFFPRVLKKAKGIDYSRFWEPEREPIKLLFEGKRAEAEELLKKNVKAYNPGMLELLEKNRQKRKEEEKKAAEARKKQEEKERKKAERRKKKGK